MAVYLVFVCPRCGLPRYAREGQKSAKCLRCNSRIPINSHKTRILLKTKNATEAIETVKRYKEKTELHGRL